MSNYNEIKSLVYGKLVDKTDDRDYTELAELAFGKPYSSDVARRMFYGARNVIEAIENEQISNISDNDIINEIDIKKLELEKEKIKFRDQRREFMNQVRPQARFERMLEVLQDSVEDINKIKPITYNPIYKYNGGRKEAILLASDWHIDSKFNHCLGEYNLEIAKSRLEDLLAKTIEYCNVNDVNTLHIELLGDNISGGIHWSSKVNAEEDTISQVMTLCELLTSFITELCNHIPNVKVYSVIGNHSRLSMNKKESQQGENLERLIPFYLKARLNEVENISIMDNCNVDDGIIMFDVLGSKIIGVHGDIDRPTQVVDNMIKMFRVIPSEIHMGHLHHHYEKEEYDIEVIINGSLQGTDYYAKDIRKSGRPMQKLMIYDDNGKLCTYKIKL